MDAFLDSTTFTICLQLGLSIVLGMLLGMERSIAGKAAGMRTYALVSLGATLFVVAGLAAAPELAVLGGVDHLRVAAAIITGIGFIGAGTIIFRRDALKGLTTAAGLWVAAGIGIAVGYGLYAVALAATLLTLFVFTALWYVESLIERNTTQPDERVVISKEKRR